MPTGITYHSSAFHGVWRYSGNSMRPYLDLLRHVLDHGTPKAEAYSITMYIMAGLLVVGLICNAIVSEVDKKYHYVES